MAPAVFTVNTTLDTNAVNLSTGQDSSGNVSLRSAIEASNSIGGSNTIQFDSSLNGQTITLSGSALPGISQNVTITGLGASNLAISGNKQSEVFAVASGATVSISGLTIENGNAASGVGGGIENVGTLTVNDSTLSGNSASEGGGIYNDGTLTVSDSTFADNSASEAGAGIYNTNILTVSDSILSDNSAKNGGGIGNDHTLTVSNSTFAGNSASNDGGGIADLSGSATVLNNTIVANGTSGGDLYDYSSGDSFAGAYDIIEDGSYLGSFTNSLSINPLLAPLGNYGGPTETMALLPGSAAIGAGDPSQNGTTDQRGFARGSSVDIGAFQTQASPLLVNTADDTATGAEPAGELSLRDAINLANVLAPDSGAHTITFDSSLSGRGIYLSGIALPAITQNVSIVGLGESNLAIVGNYQSEVFAVASGATVSISGLTIADGNADFGGGIENVGTLTVSDSELIDNSAEYGGGIANYGGLTLNNCTFLGNSASDVDGGSGGAIYNDEGNVTVSNCTIADNSTNGGGGGVGSGGQGTLTVLDSTLADNSAAINGGGIYDALDESEVVSNSTLVGNSAGGYGGGIYNEQGTPPGTLTVSDSTLADNSAAINGGGIAQTSNTTTLNNTIVADSTSGDDLYLIPGYGGSFSGSNDLIGDGSNLSDFTNSLSGNPLLAPLGNYGGPTETMALLPGSPAIGAGDPAQSGTTDQRGKVRGSRVDIGAYQTGVFTMTTTADDPNGPIAGQTTLRDAINEADADPGSTIDFNIPATDPGYNNGVWTIQPAAALPAITAPVMIDGTSQPGYNGKPLIVLSGVNAGNDVVGLDVTGGNSTVKGLVINKFGSAGIELTTNGGDVIEGNYIGTDATGNNSQGNGGGIDVSVSNVTIGGSTAAARNIISSNRDDGIGLGASDVLVQGNYIGTNAAGSSLLTGQYYGVEDVGANNNTISDNIISGNGDYGLYIGNASGVQVQGYAFTGRG
jgi:fibronectin-binding autotransporter adhesin